jgi:transposase InsO family protein
MNKREVKAMVDKYDAGMQQITAMLDAAIDTLKAWEAHPDQPPTPAELAAHLDNLLLAYARQRVLEGDARGVRRLLTQLLNQYRSAHLAFRMGWEARLTDMLAHLNKEEEAQLRKLIRDIQHDSEMPF